MFRWGFIGSVGISETVAKELVKCEGQEIVAVYSRNLSHCQKFAKKYGGKAYSSYEEMLEDKNIDAIYVATPHSLHFYYAKRALEKHIPVLSEKSLTLGYESTVELFRIAEENNTYLAEAMWTWFNPTAIKVREWINDKKIGDVKSFYGRFSVPTAWFGRKPRLFDPKYGGGSLLDLGVYPITYAYALFGYPKSIEAQAKMKNGVDYKTKAILHYEGFDCIAECGFTSMGTCPIKITGEKGNIYVGPVHHNARKAKISGFYVENFADKENIGGYARELKLVSEEIQNGLKESAFVPKKQTIECMKIMEEIKSIIGLVYPNDIK